MVGTRQNLFHNCSYRIFYTTKFEPKKQLQLTKQIVQEKREHSPYQINIENWLEQLLELENYRV